ncbi:MAG: phosphoribosyl-ATP pyrophosphohydrolase [Cellvibrionaceae bacterium]|jgi:phosphoribosyl-ATP pyrophosphohydrolase
MNELKSLEALLKDRKENPKEGSYTNTLFNDPEELVKKVGEESIEVILAALQQGPERLISEAADLIYHLSVLLVSHGVSWDDIEAELATRK